jgi:uncharacterized membrane protein YdbT with pleckstrin-like domain
MSYIDRNLLPGEQILYRTKKHLIVFFYPLVLTIFVVYAQSYMHNNFILARVEWVPYIVVLIFWGFVGIEYLTSEFVVTDKRIMMREGFFIRHTNELRITTISQVNVEQNLIGQMLDYGTVALNAFGAYDAFYQIAHPITFQKYANEQLDKMVK